MRAILAAAFGVSLTNALMTMIGVDCEVNNHGGNDWHEVTGNPVVWFDVAGWGYDSDYDSGHWKMRIAASYTDAEEGTMIVSDLWATSRNDHHESCPPGYSRVCHWDTQGATDSNNNKGHYMTTLCAKLEECTYMKEAVRDFRTHSGNDSRTPDTLDGATKFLTMDVAGGGARSYYDNSRGSWNTSFYKLKGPCTDHWVPPTADTYCSGQGDQGVHAQNCEAWVNQQGLCSAAGYRDFMQTFCSASCCIYMQGR